MRWTYWVTTEKMTTTIKTVRGLFRSPSYVVRGCHSWFGWLTLSGCDCYLFMQKLLMGIRGVMALLGNDQKNDVNQKIEQMRFEKRFLNSVFIDLRGCNFSFFTQTGWKIENDSFTRQRQENDVKSFIGKMLFEKDLICNLRLVNSTFGDFYWVAVIIVYFFIQILLMGIVKVKLLSNDVKLLSNRKLVRWLFRTSWHVVGNSWIQFFLIFF